MDFWERKNLPAQSTSGNHAWKCHAIVDLEYKEARAVVPDALNGHKMIYRTSEHVHVVNMMVGRGEAPMKTAFTYHMQWKDHLEHRIREQWNLYQCQYIHISLNRRLGRDICLRHIPSECIHVVQRGQEARDDSWREEMDRVALLAMDVEYSSS